MAKIFEDVVKRSYLNIEDTPIFHALVITNCNGTGSFPFSRASVEYMQTRRSFPSVTWFGSGFISIAQAFKGNNTFTGENTFGNFEQTVLKETKHLECLRSLLESESKSEAKVRNILAAHYFEPLVYGGQCIIEKGSLNVCDHCKKTISVGDTSLGHSWVWHGRADIVIKNSAIKVTVEPTMEEDDDDDGTVDSATEEEESDDFANEEPATKCRKIDSTFSSIILARSQALAEAIVNAFCEAKNNKFLAKKFIPSFLATEQYITIILYNLDLDILLLSDKFPIWNPYASLAEATLNVDTLLQVWLALNIDHFDMDLNEKMLSKTKCSNFKKVVGEEVYRIYLKAVSKPYEPFRASGPIIGKLAAEDEDDTFTFVGKTTDWYYKKVISIMKEEQTVGLNSV